MSEAHRTQRPPCANEKYSVELEMGGALPMSGALCINIFGTSTSKPFL